MKGLLIIVFACFGCLGSSWLVAQPLGSSSKESSVERSVYDSILRIEVSRQEFDYQTPWNTGRFSGGIGTGFIIGKNQIMTNAHVVSNAQRILVSTHRSSQKHVARVVHIAHDSDLALLELEDFSSFEGYPVFEFGGIPVLESMVRAIGYPVGGQRLSVTRGVVSRIDFRPYSHSQVHSHLVIQIDAAINPGNSGGPVLQDGKVIGVAFQGLTQADNTGYIIPVSVIQHFLTDIKDGRYDTYPSMGIMAFNLHNPAMRRAFGLSKNAPGVLVSSVIADSSADSLVKKHDVLVSIDGYEIDRGGSIAIDGQRINFNEIVERKLAGDSIKLGVIRDGEHKEVSMTLKVGKHASLYENQYEKRPRYVFCAGLTFQPLNRNLYSAHRFGSARVRKIYTSYLLEGIFKQREDIVILTRIENDELTSYVKGFKGAIVDSVNGEPINNLNELHDLLYAENPPEFFEIRFNGLLRPMIIPSSQIAEANQRMQKTYGIPALSNLTD